MRKAAVYVIVIFESCFSVSPPVPGVGVGVGDAVELAVGLAELEGQIGAGAGENLQGVALGDGDAEAVVCSAIGTGPETIPKASKAPITAPNITIEISSAARAVHLDPSATAAS